MSSMKSTSGCSHSKSPFRFVFNAEGKYQQEGTSCSACDFRRQYDPSIVAYSSLKEMTVPGKRCFEGKEMRKMFDALRLRHRFTSLESDQREDVAEGLQYLVHLQEKGLNQSNANLKAQFDIRRNLQLIEGVVQHLTETVVETSERGVKAMKTGLLEATHRLNITGLTDIHRNGNSLLEGINQQVEKSGLKVCAQIKESGEEAVKVGHKMMERMDEKQGGLKEIKDEVRAEVALLREVVGHEVRGLREEVFSLRQDMGQMVQLMASISAKSYGETTLAFFETRFPVIMKQVFVEGCAEVEAAKKREEDASLQSIPPLDSSFSSISSIDIIPLSSSFK